MVAGANFEGLQTRSPVEDRFAKLRWNHSHQQDPKPFAHAGK
jgi:hypothetical protein